MIGVFRIGKDDDGIHVEHWPDWDSFDAMRPALRSAADIALFVAGTSPHDQEPGGANECQRIRANNGKASTTLALLKEDLALWQTAGALSASLFEVVHGHDVPAFLLVLRWKSLADALRAQIQFESNMDMADRYRSARSALGVAPIRSVNRILGSNFTFIGHH